MTDELRTAADVIRAFEGNKNQTGPEVEALLARFKVTPRDGEKPIDAIKRVDEQRRAVQRIRAMHAGIKRQLLVFRDDGPVTKLERSSLKALRQRAMELIEAIDESGVLG